MLLNSVAATAASRLYLAVIALLFLPVYRRLLGEEAYGLVALFFMMQVWFQLLDVGLGATLARETARHRAGALQASELRQLLRASEFAFLAMAMAAGLGLFLTSAPLVDRWLRLERVSAAEARMAIELLALGLAVRLLGEPYRGILAGFERLTWLAGCNAVFGTLRWLGVVPFLGWAGASAKNFFAFQLLVGVLETLLLLTAARALVPRTPEPQGRWSLRPLRRVVGFSLTMSLASIVWIVLSQLDKLVLSGMLTLSDFGAFSLAASGAAGVLMATGSLTDTLTPRFTRLHASGSLDELRALYRRATQWAGLVAWPIAALMASQAERVLWVWTGDAALARRMGPVLALYSLGNAALAIGAFPYYLQLARGELRLHLLGTGLMVALLLPALVWATAHHGATGAAAVWLGVNLLYLAAWTPIAHGSVAPGLHGRWMLHDVAPIAAAAAAAAWACQALPWPDNRAGTGLMLVLAVAVTLAAGAAGSGWVRGQLGSGAFSADSR